MKVEAMRGGWWRATVDNQRIATIKRNLKGDKFQVTDYKNKFLVTAQSKAAAVAAVNRIFGEC